MILIILYELAWILVFIGCLVIDKVVFLPDWITHHNSAIHSVAFSGLGGVTYCLRGIYINHSVKNNFDKRWHVWYYLRPLTSILSGVACFIFLKAGMLVLDAKVQESSSGYGFFALSFIAGYNVDNFMKKLESIAHSVWGIEKSKVGKVEENE